MYTYTSTLVISRSKLNNSENNIIQFHSGIGRPTRASSQTSHHMFYVLCVCVYDVCTMPALDFCYFCTVAKQMLCIVYYTWHSIRSKYRVLPIVLYDIFCISHFFCFLQFFYRFCTLIWVKYPHTLNSIHKK